jgi:hypothetical protein
MPKGARRENRPGKTVEEEAIENAIKVAMISTGEIEEGIDPKSAAAELGRRGGKARKQALSPERRKEIARTAAIKRWQKHRDQSSD